MNYFANALTLFVNFDFKLDALFLCITLFLANLSIIATTLGNKVPASVLVSVSRNFLIALRVVLA